MHMGGLHDVFFNGSQLAKMKKIHSLHVSATKFIWKKQLV